MDIGLLAGLGLAVLAILGSNLMDGGSIFNLINPSAALLVIGGTLGATAVSVSLQDLAAVPRLVAGAVRPKREDLDAAVQRLVTLAVKARRNGLLSLEEDIAAVPDGFLSRGLQMVVDGADADALRSVMQTEIALRERRIERESGVFETAGGFAPTMGIIGTVMGLIHVLGNLSNASALGPSIATAFLATFYGIASANVVWLPLAAKLRLNAAGETVLHEVLLEGILSIQAGDNPSAVRDKLTVFLRSPGQPAADAAPEPAPEADGAEHRVA